MTQIDVIGMVYCEASLDRGSGFGIRGSGFETKGFGIRDSGFGIRDSGFGSCEAARVLKAVVRTESSVVHLIQVVLEFDIFGQLNLATTRS